LFNFDVHPEYAGKTCNIVFYSPPEPHLWWQHFSLNASGGIKVSRLEQIATNKTSASNVGNSTPVGSVDRISLGQGHHVSSAPCETGKVVGYRVDSHSGLDMSWFQMVTPASGLFMTVSG
jgi:glucan endo-1,3-beta-D-glucosidase